MYDTVGNSHSRPSRSLIRTIIIFTTLLGAYYFRFQVVARFLGLSFRGNREAEDQAVKRIKRIDGSSKVIDLNVG